MFFYRHRGRFVAVADKAKVIEAYRRGDKIIDIAAANSISHGRVVAIAREAGVPFRKDLRQIKKQNTPRNNDLDKDIAALYPKLLRYAYILYGQQHKDRAEDLVQATMLHAMEGERLFKRGTNIESWCFTILRNLRIQTMRKTRKEHQYDEDLFNDMIGVDVAVRDRRSEHMTKAKLITLPNQEHNLQLQDVLKEAKKTRKQNWSWKDDHNSVETLLKVVLNDDYKSVADELGISEGTIKSRLNRGRKQLEDAGV